MDRVRDQDLGPDLVARGSGSGSGFGGEGSGSGVGVGSGPGDGSGPGVGSGTIMAGGSSRGGSSFLDDFLEHVDRNITRQTHIPKRKKPVLETIRPPSFCFSGRQIIC